MEPCFYCGCDACDEIHISVCDECQESANETAVIVNTEVLELRERVELADKEMKRLKKRCAYLEQSRKQYAERAKAAEARNA